MGEVRRLREALLDVPFIITMLAAIEWDGLWRAVAVGTVPFIIRRIARQEARRG